MSNHTNLHTDPQRPARLSRRTFLGVVLGALPAAALPGGALAGIWPKSELDREVDEPWVLALDRNVLWDPADDRAVRVPTLRGLIADALPEIKTASGRDLDAVIAQYVLDTECLDEDDGEEWRAALARNHESLDLPITTDSWQFVDWYEGQLRHAALSVWWELPDEIREEFDVYLIEGDRPGSSLTYVRYDGELGDLNRDLAAAGVNIVVIEQEEPCELIYPDGSGY